jgi:hypothetical protein
MAKRARMTGTLTSGEGLEMDVTVIIRDEQDAADEVANDIVGMFNTYMNDITGVEQEPEVVTVRAKAQNADTAFEDLVAQLRANIAGARS